MSQTALKQPVTARSADLDATLFRAESQNRAETAAGGGHAATPLTLDLLYLTGNGVPEDRRRTVQWIRLAAERDDVRAQYLLAHCYLNGLGLQPDHFRAYFWCRIAMANGHPDTNGIADSLGQHLARKARRSAEAELHAVPRHCH